MRISYKWLSEYLPVTLRDSIPAITALAKSHSLSNICNATENLISEALRQVGSTKTTIVIAHRLTTVQHCDRIYEMSNGEIVRSGSYQQIVMAGKNFQG